MKFIVINEVVSSEMKTDFLRDLEEVLIKNKLLKSSQLKTFRNYVAVDVIQLLNELSTSLKETVVQTYDIN
jgi:hypothetical protein